eukprot:gene7208-biopygen13557
MRCRSTAFTACGSAAATAASACVSLSPAAWPQSATYSTSRRGHRTLGRGRRGRRGTPPPPPTHTETQAPDTGTGTGTDTDTCTDTCTDTDTGTDTRTGVRVGCASVARAPGAHRVLCSPRRRASTRRCATRPASLRTRGGAFAVWPPDPPAASRLTRDAVSPVAGRPLFVAARCCPCMSLGSAESALPDEALGPSRRAAKRRRASAPAKPRYRYFRPLDAFHLKSPGALHLKAPGRPGVGASGTQGKPCGHPGPARPGWPPGPDRQNYRRGGARPVRPAGGKMWPYFLPRIGCCQESMKTGARSEPEFCCPYSLPR